MNLSKEDLQAIRAIIEEVVEGAMRQTAAGFAEVHSRIDGLVVEMKIVKKTVGRIDSVQQAELQRNDHQDIAITRIRKSMHAV